MAEKTTWWTYCGIPSEPRKATTEEAMKYQEAMRDGTAFISTETNNQRKIRELYGLYSSVPEVPGVVHFDDFAPPGFGEGGSGKVKEANTINGGAEIPSAAWFPAWLGLSTVEPLQEETPSSQADRSALAWMRNQQLRRASAKLEFDQWQTECTRRRKAAVAELQRDALLLSCAASSLNADVKDALKGGVQDFFSLENAMLSSSKF